MRINHLIDNFKSNIHRSKNKYIVRLYLPYYRFRNRKNKDEEIFSINHKLKIIYVHNPKTAGTSIKSILGLSSAGANHKTPTFLVSKTKWESYYSIVAVRHPIARLLSSYYYHTQKNYTGGYLKKYPDLQSFDLKTYFYKFKNESWAIRPQVDYIEHLHSNKKVDFILHFESLQDDIKLLCDKICISLVEVPHLNKSRRDERKNILFEDKDFMHDVMKYYEKDFQYFNYSEDISGL